MCLLNKKDSAVKSASVKCKSIDCESRQELDKRIIKQMESSDKCMAMCVWALASVLMVGTICLTIYHLQFVESGLVQRIETVPIPVKVWVKQ